MTGYSIMIFSMLVLFVLQLPCFEPVKDLYGLFFFFAPERLGIQFLSLSGTALIFALPLSDFSNLGKCLTFSDFDFLTHGKC